MKDLENKIKKFLQPWKIQREEKKRRKDLDEELKKITKKNPV